jgi:YD repeat-containing protein
MAMKKESIFLWIIFCFAMSTDARSQTSPAPGLKNIVSPSPNAAALGKYGEIPVNLYTGIPNINIPLYNLKGRELELPISLNYHAGGIRVEEIAAWVGSGWSLNAGGIVTRSVRGIPDDVLGGYFGARVNLTALSKKYIGSSSGLSSIQLQGGNGQNVDISTYQGIISGIADSQPDIFYFNFGKYSGSFFMNESGQFVVSPLEALKVQVFSGSANNQRIDQWILTTPDGVKYVFGSSLDGTRTAWENNDNGSPWGYTTTGWYLMDIYSPHNDRISLNYNNISYTYNSRTSELNNQIINQVNGGVLEPQSGKILQIVPNNMTVPRLTSITSVNGTVNFSAGANRTDLPGENSLANINVYSNQQPNSLLQQWQFYYDYSTNRLTLDSIAQYAPDPSASGQKYRFSYTGSLPSYDPNGVAINSQDLWGYYNGVNNTVFPQGYTIYSPQYGQISVQGADRHSDSMYMQYGTLNRIYYPTGGYTQFDFEPNQVFGPADDNSIPPPPVSHDTGQVYTYKTSFSDTFTIVYPDPNSGTVPITITSMSILPPGSDSACPTDGNGFSNCFTATLKGIDGTSYALNDWKIGTTSTTLLPGTYVLSGIGSPYPGVTVDTLYRLYIDWTEYPPASGGGDPLQPVNKTIGGLRIKRTTNYDGISSNVTRYSYSIFNDTASSGVLVNPPYSYANVFEQLQETCTETPEGEVDQTLATTFLQTRGYPLIPLMPTQGSSIGYQNVTKYEGENGENGKEEYTYTTANSFPDELDSVRPFAPSCSFDWRRGLLLNSTTYKNSGGNFIPVEVKSNSYLNSIKSSVGYGLGIESSVQVNQSGQCQVLLTLDSSYYSIGSFRTVSEFQYLQADTDRVYDQNNPNEYVQTIRNYKYDTVQGHYQITSTITYDSKNQAEETDYKYPQDLTLTGYEETARDTLIADFILTPVLETTMFRNGAQIRDTKNNFMVFSNGYALPQSVDQQIGAFPLERRVQFLRYDNYANLTAQQKTSDAINSYIWNYNQSYPIASVVNADSTDIAYTSFEADGSGNWSVGSGTSDSTTSITGRKSYNLSGSISKAGLTAFTTYYVSYWTLAGVGPLTIAGTISGYPVKGKTVTFNNASWTLYVHKVTGQTTITVSGSGHIDELRLYPVTAQMTTYTYDPLVGVTTQTDPGNRATYYEYDGLQRLKRIRDQDYNILKSIAYQYQAPAGCGSGCYAVAMQTFAGSNTLSYPVGVFNVHGKLLGNVINDTAYVTTWNRDTADSRLGTLAAGADSMHFNMTLNAGQTMPSGVIGCRYYQWDIAWTNIDAIPGSGGAYVDFGDGTGVKIPKNATDTGGFGPQTTFINGYYIVHTYADSSLKTITVYHNDGSEYVGMDNAHDPATSLTKVQHLRGYFPQHTIGGKFSSMQQSSALTMDSIWNWNSINSVTVLQLTTGDGINACKNLHYAQDFMKNNPGLQTFISDYGQYGTSGVFDTTFKMTRLKSNWNTYFTNLQDLQICDDHWNREDLSALTHLQAFIVVAGNHDGYGAYNPIPSQAVDSIINQIAAGAGQNVSNGLLGIASYGGGRSAASNTSLDFLLSKGWKVILDGVYLTPQ